MEKEENENPQDKRKILKEKNQKIGKEAKINPRNEKNMAHQVMNVQEGLIDFYS